MKKYFNISRTANSKKILHRYLTRSALTLLLIAATVVAGYFGWSARAGGKVTQDNSIWSDDSLRSGSMLSMQGDQRYLRMNRIEMERLLSEAPIEISQTDDLSPTILPIPMPDGTITKFRITQSTIVDNLIAARYPDIHTYVGQSIDDPGVTMRADLTPLGFHATIILPEKTVSIHPASSSESSDRYISYHQKEGQMERNSISCEVIQNPFTEQLYKKYLSDQSSSARFQVGSVLRTYRIAVTTTWEYSELYGGGKNALTIASIVTWLNSVNAIFERDLAVRLILVDAPSIIYSSENGYSASSDPFREGGNLETLQDASGALSKITSSSFDVGHVLKRGGGGVAFLRSVCGDQTNDFGLLKSLGVSGFSLPLGDLSELKVLAHELGHQFGAGHTFNGTVGDCNAQNRTKYSAFEPGSGATIMSYNGLCGSDNFTSEGQSLRFHLGSQREMLAFIEETAKCHRPLATANRPPSVNAGPDYTIPIMTPFELRASGSDPDQADAAHLTYVWEQVDAGGNFTNPPYTDKDDPPFTTRPLFRSYGPKSSPTRFFPSIEYVLNSNNIFPDIQTTSIPGESLPATGRLLNFGVALRDNRPGGGGMADDQVTLTVAANAGPFSVTQPNNSLSWPAASAQTVTWQVNNTNRAPVNCTNVRISLSTDGGHSFPFVLKPSTPNDGSETVTIPATILTSTARIKIEAVGNIFFDISNANFTVTAPVPSRNSAKFISQDVPVSLQPGATQVIKITMMNDGDTTWTSAEGYRLGSVNPRDNNTWGFGARVDLPTNTNVAPGQRVTFTFPIKAPTKQGTYNLQMRMLREQVAWFGAETRNAGVAVRVDQVANAKFISQSVPGTMTVRQSVPVEVTLENNGTMPWSSSNSIKLGSQSPQDNNIWGFGGRVKIPAGTVINPGSKYTFKFNVRAPSQTGSYDFQVRMLQEGVRWFGDSGQKLVVKVKLGQ